MGLPRQDDAFELRVGEDAVGDELHGQLRAVSGRRVGHRGHGGGLHQRRGVGLRPGNPDGCGPPRCVRVGGRGLSRRFACIVLRRTGLVGEFIHRPPVPAGPGRLARASTWARGWAKFERVRVRALAARRGVGDRLNRDRAPRRYPGDDGGEQCRCIADRRATIEPGASGTVRVCRGGHTVEHGQAGIEGRAVAGIGAPVDGDGKHRTGRRIEAAECARPGGIVRKAIRGGNGHQPPARRQHRTRRTQMAQVGVMTAASDVGAHREWRVHQHHRGRNARQVIGDGFGVVAGHGRTRKQTPEQPRAGGGQFVQVQRTGDPCAERTVRHDPQQPRAGGRFEHPVAGPDRGGLDGGVGERKGRGKLLKPDLFLRPAGLGRFERREAFEHREHGGGTAGAGPRFAAHGAPITFKKEHERRLGGVVRILPHPGAFGVGGAERFGQGLAQKGRRKRAAGLKRCEKRTGRGQQGGGLRANGRGIGRRPGPDPWRDGRRGR